VADARSRRAGALDVHSATASVTDTPPGRASTFVGSAGPM
jgi:hypothetical protein